MELYINNEWTECHAAIYTTGATAEEADAKLVGALRELQLVPETSIKDDS